HELKRDYQTWLHKRDRDRPDYDGHPDRTAEEIRDWALEHDLPYFDGEMHFPDLRVEYQEMDGRWDHDDIEVTTEHYRGEHAASVARGVLVLRRLERSGRGSLPRSPSRRGIHLMTSLERAEALADYGFTERQARFLVLVMRHAGLCVKRQYAAFAGIANG